MPEGAIQCNNDDSVTSWKSWHAAIISFTDTCITRGAIFQRRYYRLFHHLECALIRKWGCISSANRWSAMAWGGKFHTKTTTEDAIIAGLSSCKWAQEPRRRFLSSNEEEEEREIRKVLMAVKIDDSARKTKPKLRLKSFSHSLLIILWRLGRKGHIQTDEERYTLCVSNSEIKLMKWTT